MAGDVFRVSFMPTYWFAMRNVGEAMNAGMESLSKGERGVLCFTYPIKHVLNNGGSVR